MRGKMKNVLILVIALLVCGLSTSQASAETLVLQPPNGKDAEIDSGQPDRNFGSHGDLTTNWWHGLTNKGLIEFGLNSITDATINSATLSLYQITNIVNGASFGIYQITQSWDENTVTWNTRPTTVSTPDSILNINDSSWCGWRDWDVRNLVQGWVSGAYNNYGMMLSRIPEQNPVAYFASSDSSYKPKLTIDYTPIPEPASLLLLGSGLLGLAAFGKAKKRKI